MDASSLPLYQQHSLLCRSWGLMARTVSQGHVDMAASCHISVEKIAIWFLWFLSAITIVIGRGDVVSINEGWDAVNDTRHREITLN